VDSFVLGWFICFRLIHLFHMDSFVLCGLICFYVASFVLCRFICFISLHLFYVDSFVYVGYSFLGTFWRLFLKHGNTQLHHVKLIVDIEEYADRKSKILMTKFSQRSYWKFLMTSLIYQFPKHFWNSSVLESIKYQTDLLLAT